MPLYGTLEDGNPFAWPEFPSTDEPKIKGKTALPMAVWVDYDVPLGEIMVEEVRFVQYIFGGLWFSTSPDFVARRV